MPKPSLVVILVEDERHEMLVRRYLRRLQMEAHQMTFLRSPSGAGSAEQWVRTRFAKEVRAYRSRHARAASALIVMIDADAHSVDERIDQLDQSLTEDGAPVVRARERVVRLIPKRNVETWILCLNGESVDEETDYKRARTDWNELIPPASATLFRWTRPNAKLAIGCTDSLRRGVDELTRLAT